MKPELLILLVCGGALSFSKRNEIYLMQEKIKEEVKQKTDLKKKKEIKKDN